MFKNFFGDSNEKAIKKMQPIVDKIGGFESAMEKLSDEDLRKKTDEFKTRLKKNETTDDILPEAYAVVREAAKRALSQRHYDVQLVGGIVLHQARIAEMKTGEGKTLTSTLPIYLNALGGEGLHVVTVNDFLAKRDVSWMGQIYDMLGLSVGVITNDGSYLYDKEYAKQQAEDRDKNAQELDAERDTVGSFKVEEEFLRPCERKESYAADITYGTNNEFGFDFLRDNLAQKAENKVQRGHHFAIVDEIDSILIDEARTPLIISAPDTESTDLYKTFAKLVVSLKEDTDYNVDYKMKAVSISEEGIEKIEKALGIKNLYDPAEGGGVRYVHNLEQALKANILFTRDKDYVVKDGEIIIVDEFTGRLMPGRRYSQGLHQAIEAKENVDIQRETRTVASITFQNYFRMYKKLAGMTGTAATSSEEFYSVYKLDVTVVPTNKPLVREALRDLVFRNEEGKFKAVVAEIKRRHETGQPLLVGTTSIEKNEYLSRLLQKEGIKHELLNAKNHEREGAITAQAGRVGAITIATNMAGRGVDIILGGNPPSKEEAQKAKDFGGLHVIGTERHEARRIDDQLRGRAGRQGDPGSSQFFVSLEDEIMRVFGGDRIKSIMQTLKLPDDVPIESKLVTGAIESAQKKIEGFNFDARKQVLEYDEVLNKHRGTIYKKRDKVLVAQDEEIDQMVTEHVQSYFGKLLDFHLQGQYKEDWNMEEVFEELRTIMAVEDRLHRELQQMTEEHLAPDVLRDKTRNFVFELADKLLDEKKQEVGEEEFMKAQRWLLLRTIDLLWMDHIDAMHHLRDTVRLRAYAQRDPLIEYKNEGIQMFEQLKGAIEADVVKNLFKIQTHTHQHAAPKVVQNIIAKKEGGVLGEKGEEVATKNVVSSNKIGRNDPCPCGAINPNTGQVYKYKKCGEINAPHHKG